VTLNDAANDAYIARKYSLLRKSAMTTYKSPEEIEREKKAEEWREQAAKAHETASATLSKLPEDIRKAYEKQLEMLARLMTK
jgi:hypothetical protein